MLIFCIIRIRVYSIFGKGLFSGSVYRILGGYRSCAQAVSYEIRMVFLILLLIFFWCNVEFDFFYLVNFNFMYFFIFSFPLIIIWLLVCLCESNRSPFDLSEGESELVSGFNTEYGGGGFSLIFISEYGSIIFLGFFSCLLFFGGGLIMICFILLVRFLFVHVRLSYPRMRYDNLILIAWKIILIFVIFIYFWGIYY